MQCTAKSKRSGKRCKNRAIKGKDKCRMHGGATPVEHGLFSKYPDAIVGGHMDAAKKVAALASLEQTIPVLIAIMSLWVERGIVFAPKHYLATCTLMGRLTTAVETFEKLNNPGGRNDGGGKEQINEYIEALSSVAEETWANEGEKCDT
ncbi:MAG: hypothetical protein IBX61_09740 [Thermoleophilia bacterium]|nr:hypothetical protein [Thermoleophilia bacterium]